MTLETLTGDVVIQAVVFGMDASMEISYLERREQQEHVSQMRTIQVDMSYDLETFHELSDTLAEIVDRGQEMLRRPQDFDELRRRRERA